MFRLLLLLLVLVPGSMIAELPNSPLQAPIAMDPADNHVAAEHDGSTHASCDFSCLGCSHSVHDMCPGTLLTRGTKQQHHAVYRVQTTVRQGYRNSLLRPPISSPLQLT